MCPILYLDIPVEHLKLQAMATEKKITQYERLIHERVLTAIRNHEARMNYPMTERMVIERLNRIPGWNKSGANIHPNSIKKAIEFLTEAGLLSIEADGPDIVVKAVPVNAEGTGNG